MNETNLEFLDLLAIISFGLQMQLIEDTQRQATNNDILVNLHRDLEVVDAKLNLIMQHLGLSLENSD